jgi:hypothetical protein
METPITLNVGGRVFQTYPSTLMKYPETMLARFISSGLAKPNDKGEYFFDRNTTAFEAILDIYRNDKLACPPTVPLDAFNEELAYWGFDLIPEPVQELTNWFNLNEVLTLLLNRLLDVDRKQIKPDAWNSTIQVHLNPILDRDSDVYRVVTIVNEMISAKMNGQSTVDIIEIQLSKSGSDMYRPIIQQFFNPSIIQETRYPVIVEPQPDGPDKYHYVKDNQKHPVNYANVYSILNAPYVVVYTCKMQE